jgi:hypothetical protein
VCVCVCVCVCGVWSTVCNAIMSAGGTYLEESDNLSKRLNAS